MFVRMLPVAAVFWSSLAAAQPIIIPLEPQKEQQAPAPTNPPVAPPMAGPSLPADTQTAGGPAPTAPQQETASQPPTANDAPAPAAAPQ